MIPLDGSLTSQSSVGSGRGSALAVDGNKDGHFASGSCSHTQNEENPWWAVNLGDTYKVTAVTVWNRIDTNCDEGQCSKLHLLI